jgi:multiple sugar transport system substrate-binding protein
MNDLQTIAATAAETGAGPDIVELNQNSPFLFAEALADVSDVCEDLGGRFGGWHDVAVEACYVEDKWLAVPRFLAAHAMNYREDYLTEVGYGTPPTTWDEMLDCGKKLKEAGLPQMGFPLGHAVGDGNNFNYSMLWSFGGKEVEADGKTVAINSPETAAAVDFMRTLYTEALLPEVLSWDDSSNNRAFLGGEVSVTNNAASIWATARTSAPDVFAVTNHFPYPEGPAGAVLYGEMMSQCVFNYTQNLDAAKALLVYLNEKTQYDPWSIAGYSFLYPLLKDYEFGALMPWNSQPKLFAFKGVASHVHLPGYPSTAGRPAANAFANWIVLDMFAKAASGETTEAAIAWAEEQLTSIYGG